jgi:hypothetical protein
MWILTNFPRHSNFRRRQDRQIINFTLQSRFIFYDVSIFHAGVTFGIAAFVTDLTVLTAGARKQPSRIIANEMKWYRYCATFKIVISFPK